MARLNKKSLLSGKADGLIYYEYRGLPCVRSMPRNIPHPSAPGQIAQQERIAAIAIFYQALKEVGIYAYWQKAAEGMVQTGYNLLVQANLQAFDEQGCICDFAKLRLTPDTLSLPDRIALQEMDAGEWRATWENAVRHPGTDDNDCLVVALMERNAEQYSIKLPDIGTFRRKDGEARFRLPDKTDNNEKYIYIFFKNSTNCKSSNTLLFNSKT